MPAATTWIIGLWAQRVLTFLERQTKRRIWPLIVFIVAVVVSLACYFPNYQIVSEFITTPYGEAKSWWLNHPFQPVPVERFFPVDERHIGFNSGIASHLDKMTYRAFLPLMNQIFPFGIWTVNAASSLATMTLLWLTYRLVSQHTSDKVSGALITWALAACFAGQYGFNDHYRGDAVAVSLLVGAMAVQRGTLIAVLLFGACLTDERAVFATPLVLLFHSMQSLGRLREPVALQTTLIQAMRKMAGPVAMPVTLYLILRLSISFLTGAKTGTSLLFTREIITANIFNSYPETFFKVYEFLWLVVLLFIIETPAQVKGDKLMGWILVSCLAVSALPAYIVIDFDRSLIYLLPGLISAACFLRKPQQHMRTFYLAIAMGNLIWIYPSLSAMRLIADLIPG
jgi:hypothetical protein